MAKLSKVKNLRPCLVLPLSIETQALASPGPARVPIPFASASFRLPHYVHPIVDKEVFLSVKNQNEIIILFSDCEDHEALYKDTAAIKPKGLLCEVMTMERDKRSTEIEIYPRAIIEVSPTALFKEARADSVIYSDHHWPCSLWLSPRVKKDYETSASVKTRIKAKIVISKFVNSVDAVVDTSLIPDDKVDLVAISILANSTLDSEELYHFVTEPSIEERIKVLSRSASESGETKTEISNAPEHIKKALLKELKRLKSTPTNSSEYTKIEEYIAWIKDIPWGRQSTEGADLRTIKDTLTETHYGIEPVKDLVLDHIAFRSRATKLSATVLCFTGPPGVGKTSLAKSIATACDKPFYKISLSGARDETIIRGHRRTYLGSRPGSVVNALVTSEVMDPVILLDEVDKFDASGGIIYSLLELLDPEQNNDFKDNYIDLPLDLSRVTFITTANDLQSIPPPLLDRLDVVEFKEYTEEEKQEIIKSYLFPKLKKNLSMEEDDIALAEDLVVELSQTTNVREAERLLKRLLGRVILWEATDACSFPVELDLEMLKSVVLDSTSSKSGLGPSIGFC